ncbi:MAG: UvrD-helicase domain-containing protein [Bacteroidota bacterium]|nr:UvrD-helicase domain-containing protein [Bacteroidota bacterium]
MKLPILYLNELNIQSVEKTFSKTLKQLQDGDFKSADVRKMPTSGFYRARLDIRDRLLFTFASYENQKYLLLLEVIKDHNYSHSRFLRGAIIPDEENFVRVQSPDEISAQENDLIFLNPKSRKIHLLNKFISFDQLQDSIYSLFPPLIIVGSAGSGKTALVLEKLKELPGEIAYISLSKFLVENASKIYYSSGFDNEKQEVEFLSLHNYLSSWEKPQGTEVTFRQFDSWFFRYAQTLRINEPYRVFEEFKGVITGSPVHTAWLSQAEYLELGVKQSIFSTAERERLYPVFLKYLDWLNESNMYDSNILCHQYLEKIKPRYDYIVVDEVQDITNIQLKSILQSLKHKNHFILTGDSNQIVHPNFFSWGKVKSFFYETGDHEKQIKILQTNYRNSLNVVELGNNLLKIKITRFGSIDRESNYLIGTVSKNKGEVLLFPDDDKKKNELNRRTQNSTHYAVIVPNNEQKADARRFFKTPLVFSIQEAKGLEYENVILINFVSGHEAEFREIIKGVTASDLLKEDLIYNRAANKHDKDAEIYKFYINSLYVAITRAVKNIYIFEKLPNHPALQLLQMKENKEEVKVTEAKSTLDEWLAEAQRLEDQGKLEQAEQIRAKYLGYEYLSPEQLEQVRQLALDPSKKEHEVKKERKQLFQYAVTHQRYDWVEQLAQLQFQRAIILMKELRHDKKEYAKNIRLGRKRETFSFVKKYGIDFRIEEEEVTGLMLALQHGQSELVAEYLQQHASLSQKDNSGKMAVDHLLSIIIKNAAQKKPQGTPPSPVLRFWSAIQPNSFTYETYNRQFQASSHSMVYFLLILMRCLDEIHYRKVLFKKGTPEEKRISCFMMDHMVKYAELIPDEILPPYRKKRQYINSVLSSNEINRDEFTACKMAFSRVERGVYVVNPMINWL